MKNLILTIVAILSIAPASASYAGKHRIGIDSILPSDTNALRAFAEAGVRAGQVSLPEYETIGFQELDDLTYYVARLRARASLLVVTLGNVAELVSSPEVDPDLYAALGEGYMAYADEAVTEIDRLLETAEKASVSADDFCKRKPWKCHKVIGRMKDNALILNGLQSEVRQSYARAKELFASDREDWTPPDERTSSMGTAPSTEAKLSPPTPSGTDAR